MYIVEGAGYVVQFHIGKTNEEFSKYKTSDILLIVPVHFEKNSHPVVGLG